MSYAGLTDLLSPLSDRLPELPEPQRLALEAALLRRIRIGHLPDVHTVGAGTLSLLSIACAQRPVLVAVDDLQWLDEPSLRALSFAVRRCHAAHALIVTVRQGHEPPTRDLVGTEWEGDLLQITGLGLAPLHELLGRGGHVLNRPEMQHVLDVSRGNPLFARELARGMKDIGAAQPSDLGSELRSRYLGLPIGVRRSLLVASALADPTAATLWQAGIESPETALTAAEDDGIVSWHGGRLEFAHPMWREIAYGSASARERRAAHARLSEVTADLEERAWHLALSTPVLEEATKAALEDAATSARLRGAPSRAAQLLRLALDRGAMEPRLALQAALDHFAAGANQAARDLADRVLALGASTSERARALNLLGEITYLTDDFPQAIHYLERAYREAEGEPLVRSGIAIDLGFACANLGMNQKGLEWTTLAEESAALTGERAVEAEALGAAAVLQFLCGRGVDADRLAWALGHEDVDRPSPPIRWPSTSNALVLLWSGDLERARPALANVRKRYDDRGLDSGLQVLLARLAEAAILDGDIEAATSLVAEIDEHARLDGGEAEAVLANACRVVLAAYTGDLARASAECSGLVSSTQGTQHLMARLTATAALGMGQLAAGEEALAADLLAPVAEMVLALGVGEPVISPFFADAVDALVAVGRADHAEPLVRMLEAWGQESRSRWSVGVAARGRARLLLDDGDLDAASTALDRAMEAFDARSHRYERARTRLVRAALHRRRRQRAQAQEELATAREEFAVLGASGWEDHAGRELEHLGLRRGADGELTPSEHRVAVLAASGLTNAAVAQRLSMSPKTVEAHLTRVYGKLNIHSRAELGQWQAQRSQS